MSNVYGPDKQLCSPVTDFILPLGHTTIMSDTCQINLNMLLASFPSSRPVLRSLWHCTSTSLRMARMWAETFGSYNWKYNDFITSY